MRGGGNGGAPDRGARLGLGEQVTTVNTRGGSVHAERSMHTPPGSLSPHPIARAASLSHAPEPEGTASCRRDQRRLADVPPAMPGILEGVVASRIPTPLTSKARKVRRDLYALGACCAAGQQNREAAQEGRNLSNVTVMKLLNDYPSDHN